MATADAGQGIHVLEWSDGDIEETFQLQMLLEPYAASLAARHAFPGLVERLEASNAAMTAAIAKGHQQAVSAIQQANRDFHLCLLEASGSPRLRVILTSMIDMPIVVRSFYLYSHEEQRQSLRQHEEITLAVREGGADLARSAMLMHLQSSHRRVLRRRAECRSPAPTAVSDPS